MWFWLLVGLVLIYFAIVSPGFRKVLLVVLAGVVAVVTWVLVNENKQDGVRRQKQAAENQWAWSAIKVTDLSINNVELKIPYVGASQWQLEGVIANNSPHTLKQVAVLVTMKDCDDKTTQLSCRIVGESRTSIYVEIPSRQTRGFRSAQLEFPNLPTQVVATCVRVPCDHGRVFNWQVTGIRAGHF